MAVQLFHWFLLWNVLCFCMKDVACLCNVSCTTDYEEYLECACAGVSPPTSVTLEANCSDDDENGMEVHGSCVVTPPSSCQMRPENISDIMMVGSKCTVVVKDPHEPPTALGGESRTWELYLIVKTLPPFNVNLKRDAESVNVTWDVNNYKDQPLVYRVRLRDPTKVRIFEETHQYLLMPSSSLLRNTRYQVDVQASLNPETRFYQGPWSTWSPTLDILEGTNMEGGETRLVLYLSIAAVCCLMGLCYFSTQFCLKKVPFVMFIPDPAPFFKPLHHKHDGNFQDWVRPMFSEAEVRMVAPRPTPVPVSDQKLLLLRSHHGNQTTEQGEEEGDDDREREEGEPIDVIRDVRAGGPSFLGHLSLHMVVLSVDERDERPPELYGGAGGGGGGARPGEAEGGRMGGREAELPARGSKECGLAEPDLGRVLLASYCKWTDPWDDDYPRMEVDSGFGESDCSSPVSLEAASEEEPGGGGCSFTQEGGVKSNYIRQHLPPTQQHPPLPTQKDNKEP